VRPGWFGRLVRRHELCAFFVLAYLISWLAWTPWVLSADGLGVLDVRFPAILGDTQLTGLLPGAYLGPLTAAFLVTALTEGPDGLRRWRRRLLAWRVGWRWYAVVLLGLPLALLAGLLVVAGGDAGGGAGWAALGTYVPILVLQVLTSGLAEEPGWRDFALTRLQRRHGPLVATAILAPLWAGWHLPLFLTTWGAEVDILQFFLFCLLLSVVITWIFNSARESLPLIILLHANVNAFTVVVVDGFFPISGRADLAMSLGLGIAAVALILLTRGRLGYRAEPVDGNHRQLSCGTARSGTPGAGRAVRRGR
jgi:membrane protease YdiL (CAAX protease family)